MQDMKFTRASLLTLWYVSCSKKGWDGSRLERVNVKVCLQAWLFSSHLAQPRLKVLPPMMLHWKFDLRLYKVELTFWRLATLTLEIVTKRVLKSFHEQIADFWTLAYLLWSSWVLAQNHARLLVCLFSSYQLTRTDLWRWQTEEAIRVAQSFYFRPIDRKIMVRCSSNKCHRYL